MSSASSISGYSVPSSTAAQATTISTLFSRMPDSRDTSVQPDSLFRVCARAAYSASEPPTTTPRNSRM